MSTNVRFEVVERVCAKTNDGSSCYIIMQARDKESEETVWIIGDDHVCAVTHEDCIRNRNIPYNSVLIQEFPYVNYNPQDTGKWQPLIEDFMDLMLKKYLDHYGFVHVYPQWLPESAYVHLGKELFNQMCDGCDHIILRDNYVMEFVPKN